MSLPLGLIIIIKIILLGALGIGYRAIWHGDIGTIYAILTTFLSINLVICYWEIALFWRQKHIKSRLEYWRNWERDTGQKAIHGFLKSKVPIKSALSPTVWADVWATYSTLDDGYTNPRAYAFNIDVANGLFTPIPTIILYVAYTTEFLSPVTLGIIGIMFFWQWIYTTSVYLWTFFVAKLHRNIAKTDLYIWTIGTNAPWIVIAGIGLYASIRLIVDGDFSVFGR